MKKQVFSLMMVLALVVLAGTSAYAQDGTQADPFWHVNGSTHTLTVTANANSDFAWTTDATTDGTDLTWSGQATNALTITWSETAAGAYYFDVTETDQTNGCEVTVRRVYISVLDFDVYVYFSDVDGNDIEGTGAMAACSEGTVGNYGDIGPGTAFSQTVNIEGSGTAGDLSDQTGTSPQTQKYIGMTISWNIPGGASFTAPDVASMEFDYSLTLTDADGTFASINGNAATSDTDEVINESATDNLFVVPLLYDVQWGIADVTTAVTVTNCTLYDAADAGGNLLGTEINSNEAANASADPLQNTTDTQTIWSAPATSVITVN